MECQWSLGPSSCSGPLPMTTYFADLDSSPINKRPSLVRISDMNWMQVEDNLKRDDRAVLPLGSTEQLSNLRLTVDCFLHDMCAADSPQPLCVPVLPVVAYGVTP